jgi:hypothetical protein
MECGQVIHFWSKCRNWVPVSREDAEDTSRGARCLRSIPGLTIDSFYRICIHAGVRSGVGRAYAYTAGRGADRPRTSCDVDGDGDGDGDGCPD